MNLQSPSYVTRISLSNDVYVDDHLHWFGYIDDKRVHTIAAFDFGLNIFCVISFPNPIIGHGSNVLGVLAGKLCIMSCTSYRQCEVWVMDEYGEVESWAKSHVFSQFSGPIYPYGFTLRNEFICYSIHDKDLALHDPNAANVKLFKVMNPNMWKVVQYVDSLV